MGYNVATAMANIATFGNNDLKDYSTRYLNRVNAAGEQLECYFKDAIAGSFETPFHEKEHVHQNAFSYLGNQNNPPDMIVKGGDAYEVKKIENPKSTLALNSSPPKDRLMACDSRITESCRSCDGGNWEEKDIFYAIGHVAGGLAKYLFFIQGTCYAADHSTYERVSEPLKSEIDSIICAQGLEKGETNELGKVKRVDPLGITELRVRGMWTIRNPLSVYAHHCKIGDKSKFHMFALMRKEKYYSYPLGDRKSLEGMRSMFVDEISIADPNNPAVPVDSILVRFVGVRQ